MSLLAAGDENAAVFVDKNMMTPRSKMGFLRTPLRDVKNKLGSIKLSDTPQRKSSKKEKTDLKILNLQLETSNKIQQEEIKNLESQITIASATVREQEKRIKDLDLKCEGLEKSLQSPHSYFQHFKRAQQIIFELHGENREFKGLMTDFEYTAQLQARMKDELAHAAERLLSLTKDNDVVNKLKRDIAELQKHCDAYEEELSKVQGEKKEMHSDVKLMQSLLMQSNNSLSELDESWHSLHNEIKNYRDEICQLKSENASITQAFNVMMKEKIKAEEELHLCNDKMEKLKSNHGDAQTRMESYIENLQYTLDSWEVDRERAEEEIMTLTRKVESQQNSMKEMAAELGNLKENKEHWLNLEAEVDELRSTKCLLEDEKDFFTAAITDYRMKLEAELELSKSNQSLITALKSSNDELQCSHEQLQMDFYSVQEELQFADERSSTLTAVLERIHKSVDGTLSNLEQSFGVKLSQIPQPGKLQMDRHSFVRELSTMAERQGSTRKNQQPDGQESSISSHPGSSAKKLTRPLRQDNVQFGSSHKKPMSQRPQIISHSESFSVSVDNDKARMTSRRCLSFGRPENFDDDPHESHSSPPEEVELEGRADVSSPLCEKEGEVDVEIVRSSPGFAVIRHIPSTVNGSQGMDVYDEGPQFKELNSDFIEQCEYLMDSIEQMLTHITRTGRIVEKASKLGMRDLKVEIEILQENLNIKEEKIAGLESDLYAKTEETACVKAELETMSQRVSSMTDAILKHEDLGYDVRRLEEEKEDWNLREKRMTGEISLLTQQLEDIISKSDEHHGKTKDGTCLKEIVVLKKKNYQLECRIYEEMQRNKQKISKVSRRLKITEDNWQKAEGEANDLDEIIQDIRKICIDTQTNHQNPALLHIIRLIDGNPGSFLNNGSTSYAMSHCEQTPSST